MKRIYLYLLIIVAGCSLSCKKAWLEAKPNIALVIPTTLEDYEKILDNTDPTGFNLNQPALGEISSDDYYISYTSWQSRSPVERFSYMWDKDIYGGDQRSTDWENAYKQIFNANIVIDGLQKLPNNGGNADKWRAIYGRALFFRAYSHYNIATLFAGQYRASTASSELGIPLRLTGNLNDAVSRSTLKATYDQVLADLTQASQFLPADVPSTGLTMTRPSKLAAFSQLARVYLSMEDYTKAYQYADSALAKYNILMDFNALNAAANQPIPLFNQEVVFHSTLINYGIFSTSVLIVDSNLYRSYDTNDLRKDVFFRNVNNNWTWKGSYNQSRILFGGIATDELYLIRAESGARNGNLLAAMQDLNTLLLTRYKAGTFTPLSASTLAQALMIILRERRKELLFRGLRWTDLKRLNLDPNYAVTLNRNLNNIQYQLTPNDLKYVLPIPGEVITLSGLAQNPR